MPPSVQPGISTSDGARRSLAIGWRQMITMDGARGKHGTKHKRGGPLASQFQRLARQLGPDDTRAHGDLNVRLHDEERERDRGMSF